MTETPRKNYLYDVLAITMAVAAVGMPLVTPVSMSSFLAQYRNFTTCAIVLISAIAVLAASLREGGFRFGRGVKIMGIFAAITMASVLFSNDHAAALGKCVLYFSWVAVAIVSEKVFHRREYFTKFVFMFSFGAGALFLYGISGELSGRTGMPYGSSAMGISSAYGGCLLAYLFFIQGALIGVESRRGKVLAAVVLSLLVASIGWCDSYSLWILAAAGELALFLWWAAKKGVSAWKMAAVMIVIVAVTGGAMKHMVERRQMTNPAKKKESLRIRFQRWDIARDMIMDKPVFGHGPGQYEVMFPRYRAAKGVAEGKWEHDIFMQYEVNAENIIVMLLIENGIVGAVLFLAVLGWSVYSGVKLSASGGWRSDASPAFAVGTVMIFLYALFHFPFVTPGVWPVIWIGVAMLWPSEPKSVQQESSQGIGMKTIANVPAMMALTVLFSYLAMVAIVYSSADARAAKRYSETGVENSVVAPPERNRFSVIVPPTWRQGAFYGKSLSSIPERADEAVEVLKTVETTRPYSIVVLRGISLSLKVLEKERGSDPALRKEIELYEKKLSGLELAGNPHGE